MEKSIAVDSMNLYNPQECIRASTDWLYPQKTLNVITGELHEAWHSHLSKKEDMALLHASIEARFDEWYREGFDSSPEIALRQDFLRRLRTDNQLGEMLWRWEYLADKHRSPHW